MAVAEPTAVALGRLRWRCRRGMKELDQLLTAYLDGDFRQASATERSQFEALLELPDPELHAYVMGRERPDNAEAAVLIDRIVGRRNAGRRILGITPVP